VFLHDESANVATRRASQYSKALDSDGKTVKHEYSIDMRIRLVDHPEVPMEKPKFEEGHFTRSTAGNRAVRLYLLLEVSWHVTSAIRPLPTIKRTG
jgi:hypothetical protein